MPASDTELLSWSRKSLSDLQSADPAAFGRIQSTGATAARDALAAALSSVSPAAAKAAGAVDVSSAAPADVPQLLQKALGSAGLAPDDLKLATGLLQLAAAPPAAGASTPLGDRPELQPAVARAQVATVAQLAGIPPEQVAGIQSQAPTSGAIDDQALAGLIDAKVLTEPQARSLALAAQVFELVDRDPGLTAAAVQQHDARWGGGAPASTEDLAVLTAADWARLVDQAKVQLPSGTTREAYADALARRFAALRPAAAFTGRLPRPVPDVVRGQLGKLTPLLARNPKVIGVDFATLDVTGLSPDQVSAARDAQRSLTQLVNAYPGLELATALNDPHAQPDEKIATVSARIGLVDKVRTARPQLSLLTIDYAAGSDDQKALALGDLGLGADDQRRVLANLKANQRVWALAGNVDDGQKVLLGGYASSAAIASGRPEAFAASTGLDASRADALYQNARQTLGRSSLALSAFLHVWNDRNGWAAIDNTDPAAADQLRQVDGFADLFGSLSFCDCTDCQSIFGPAAYFVDLMAFVDDNVRSRYFTGSNAGHPLDLRSRRPDLWSLPLTCDNTNTRVPTLDLINEVLENYIAKNAGYTGDLGDRAAVEQLVYATTLANDTEGFGLPFTLPLARLEAYLAELGAKRGDIAHDLGVAAAQAARAELGLSAGAVSILVTPDASAAGLQKHYGLAFTVTGGIVDPVDAQDLVKAIGVTRADLGQLVAARFVGAGGATPTIVAEKSSPASVQADVEHVKGATLDALDRMHRFVRLGRALGWSVGELDLALTTLGTTAIDEAALERLATIHRLAAKVGTGVEDTLALFGAMPATPVTPGGTSLFDRVFNPPAFVGADGALPQDGTRFVHPAFRQSTGAPGDPKLSRLAVSLGVGIDDLATLAAALAPALGFSTTAPNESDRGFFLTRDNLGLLYRHVLLAQKLRLSMSDLFTLLDFGPPPAAPRVASLDDLSAAVALYDAWKSTGFTLDDVLFVSGDAPRDATRYPDTSAIATALAEGAEAHLEFQSTVLALAPGVTEQDSLAILQANPALFEQVGDAWRLAATYDLSSLPTVPAGISLTPAEVRDAVAPYHARELLLSRAAAQLGLPSDKLRELFGLVGVSLVDQALVRAVRGDGPIAPLSTALAKVAPLTVAFRAPCFDVDALEFVRQHPAVFGITAFDTLGLAALVALAVYARLATPGDPGAATRPPVDPADLQAALAAFGSGGFPPTVDAALGRIFDVGAGAIVTLRGRVVLGAQAAGALAALERAVGWTTRLGIDGQVLALVASDAYDDEARAANALLATLRAQAGTEDDRQKLLARAESPVRNRRRDALTEYMVLALHPEFDDRRELYPYFLLDVDVDGCATTSRLVGAISSVQLYVHRVLMNLEQDRRDPSDPAHVEVHLDDEARNEWTWRKNYRMWEANREVFVYPESYIEPDLRDDKTPLFHELEQTLLQQDINDQTVLDAYATYIKGFEELASLTIAGAYHDVRESGDQTVDVLHLFGIAPGDPPTYYHRTVENLIASAKDPKVGAVWTPWRKMTVQVSGRRVSPVVFRNRLYVFWDDIKTRSLNKVENGGSQFVGYQHTMRLKFTSLRADDTWSAPQEVTLPGAWPFDGSAGAVLDLLDPSSHVPKFGTVAQSDAVDDYTLSGPNWDWVWLEPQRRCVVDELYIWARNCMLQSGVDLFRRRVATPQFSISTPWPYPQALCARSNQLFLGHPYPWFFVQLQWPTVALANAVIDDTRLSMIARDSIMAIILTFGLYEQQIASLAPDTGMLALPGSPQDGLFQVGPDVVLLQGSTRTDGGYTLRRMGTTLADEVARQFFLGGVDGLLDIGTQRALQEAGLPLTPVGSRIEDKSNTGKLDFTGPYGVYYRELFFHIPFLLANHLNATERYEPSQHWYHHIFDPTATEVITLPPGLTPAQRAAKLRDRVWRYLEFRDRGITTLRDALTDPDALAVYRRDPFNPHAIARLRLSAYQKAVVMKYVDNLLDWGDFLFTQFTMESVNEAVMIYTLASDILGPRPAEVGECGEGGVTPRDYEHIGPLVSNPAGVLVELENWIFGPWWKWRAPQPLPSPVHFAPSRSLVDRIRATIPLSVQPQPAPVPLPSPGPVRVGPLGVGRVLTTPAQPIAARAAVLAAVAGAPGVIAGAGAPAGTTVLAGSRPIAGLGVMAGASASPEGGAAAAVSAASGDAGATLDAGVRALAGRSSVAGALITPPPADPLRPYVATETRTGAWVPSETVTARGTGVTKLDPIVANVAWPGLERSIPSFGWHFIRQLTPVFCVPPNKDLLAYWDRVEDRLYKIRHCLDITGAKRELALFAPEISPRLLVRMRAAGLTLEDVMSVTSGNLPPYRFTYVIERAKAFAGALQSFGQELLAALEKKDAEELARLRIVHQQNLGRMTSQIRQWEIDVADQTQQGLERQRDAAQYRKDFYDGLLSSDRNGWEVAQSIARHTASGAYGIESVIQLVASIMGYVPQVGSPFAMKYGGVELHNGMARFASSINALAKAAEAVAASSGLEAGFDRRREGWSHQKELADKEIAQLDRQIEAASIRSEIATRALALHDETQSQLDEVWELMNDRFSSLGLYTWLAGELQQVYRQAYVNALAAAKLAEQALRFERGDDAVGPGLAPTYWDGTRAGMLAGEQLLIDLQSLERRYLETNYRSLEIDQSFSLQQVDPAALVSLRETGSCEFEIPELYFDLFYPGHYKRRTRAARVTMPCITGPYTNVSATLRLLGSKMRATADTAPGALVDVPPRRSVAVATSSAQNDAGVFELSFRDERYMPFEGSGAVSRWQLTLPKTFRQFDYQTINDVILSLSYEAEEDGVLRDKVEANNSAVEGSILAYVSANPLARLFSLRQDFSTAFMRLLHGAPGTQVPLELTDRHFPMFAKGRNVQVAKATLALRTDQGATGAGTAIHVDGTSVTGFAPDATLGGLRTQPLPPAFGANVRSVHTLVVDAAGDLAPSSPAPGDPSALDAAKLADVLVYLEYRLT